MDLFPGFLSPNSRICMFANKSVKATARHAVPVLQARKVV